jgi:hypothetical protein
MKLGIVPARQGVVWVRMGMRTFLRQPLALSGLFFLFMGLMSVLTLIPVLGNVLALVLLPSATLGFMAATREAAQGQFPMPAVLLSAFRAGRDNARAMLTLGAIYAVAFLLVLAITALADGGQFARLYLVGGAMNAEVLQKPEFELALLIGLALYLPLSLMFWHAPALVHWHRVQPVQSLFFSIVACMRNFWALTVYSLTWLGAFMAMGLLVAIIAGISGSAELVGTLMFPLAMLMAAMFFTSIFFTFQDSFETETGANT